MQDNSRATQSAVESPKHFKCGTPKGNVIKFINSFSICRQKPVEGMWAHPLCVLVLLHFGALQFTAVNSRRALRACTLSTWGSPFAWGGVGSGEQGLVSVLSVMFSDLGAFYSLHGCSCTVLACTVRSLHLCFTAQAHPLIDLQRESQLC